MVSDPERADRATRPFGRVSAEFAALRARIDAIDRRWDHAVRIVAVTKGFDASAVDAAASAHFDAIGENYAQEMLAKRDALECSGADIHFIGHLQSNKVRQLTGLVSVWSTIDRASLVDEVAKRAPGAVVRLQVNTTDEAQKGGCPPAEVGPLIERARDRGLHVDGLMTVGPTGVAPEAGRPGFALLRDLVDQFDLAECSMGMTADLAVAVEQGSTEVRVGTGLFGPRPARGA
jgi:pyridoxal phosphate enzyme (YggS family)